MLAFRSEATVERWCELRGIPKGEIFAIEQAWELGRAWYGDKLSPRLAPGHARRGGGRLRRDRP